MYHRMTLCMFLICALEFGQTDELPGPGILRSQNKPVTSSSQHPEARFNISHAVDGSTRRDSAQCDCCAATIQENDPWIQVDLGRQYRVAIVEVVGRDDYNDSFNMDIFVSTTNTNWQNNPSTHPTLPDVPGHYHNVTFSYPVIGQFVTLQLRGNVLLCVCEVNIYSKDCSPGTYGLHCNETCGRCQNGETCDHVTGRCTWCDSGFRGDHCKEECLPGSFGTNCSSTCHCQDNLTCDHVNDSCPGGICDFRWHGSNCSQDTLRSLNAIVRASSMHQLTTTFNLSRAVDGSTSTNSHDCKCCAVTRTEDQPWIQIDLGRLYRVAIVEVVSRTDYYAYFAGIHIYLHENKDNWTLNHVMVLIIQSNGSPYYKTTLLNPVIAQYVTLQIPENNSMLVVCEVSVFSSDCSQGSYGLYCNETCGQCRNGEMCDHVTGRCEQCLPGYQYPLCKNKCLPGSFGHNCIETCHCQDNLTCDQVNGSCPKGICDLGWHGSNCSQECPDGTYGLHCNKTCGQCKNNQTCNHVTGNCIQCALGYQFPLCKERCPPGAFGSNCSSVCHCYNNGTCDHVAGSCLNERCDSGWKGLNCSELCSPGFYGDNCSLPCGHCRSDAPCDRISGLCNLCQPGYTGTTCHNDTISITNVTVSGSSENPDARYDLFYVMDGSNRTDSAVCNCCAATQRGNDPWLQIDLGRLYMVATVEILGRTDNNDSLSGMNIYIHTNNTERNKTLTFTENVSNVTDQYYLTTNPYPVVGQYVTLEKPGNNVSLYVCEVTVYIQDCSSGTYGRYCKEACGHCHNRETCDPVTGECTLCNPGYQLPLCNQKLQPTSQPVKVEYIVGAVVGSILSVICVLVIVTIVFRHNSKGLVKNNYLSTAVVRLRENIRSFTWEKMSDSDPRTPVEDAYAIGLQERAIEIPDDTDRRDLNSYVAPKVPVCMFWNYIHREHSSDEGTILSEFKLLKKCPYYVSTFACREENVAKNRYKGYEAYDHTRVRLVRTVGGDTDYINANYIQGFERRNKFIASQGPTVAMVEDFWLMVVQQKCKIIVMLTNVFEMGVKKCIQYWPTVGQMMFGTIFVTLLDEEEFPDYIIRRLEIKLTEDSPGHVVNQYHFVSWPDKDVPDNVWCLVNFWRVVDSKAASLTTPVLVHCSAGVGRTGTFIGLDCLFYQAEATGSVCPFEMVKRLRQQRIKMVQAAAQYVYLHEALAEAILFGTRSITQEQFEDQYEYMNNRDKDGSSRFGKQFKLIADSIEKVEAVIEETEYSNVEWNVNDDGDVSIDACNTAVDVVFLPMVTGPKSCLLVRFLETDNAEMFWKIITKFSVTTIVMATSTTHPNYEVSLNLDGTDRWSNGSLHIQMVSCDEKSKQKSFCLNGTTKVTQFQILGCEGKSPVPRDVRAVVATLNSIETWLQEQENPGPILIYCGDGTSTSGLIAVILNEILRMKLQNGTINIVESVKTMKAVEKNVVTSADQLQFCYDVVWAYLHPNIQEDVYMNV